MSADALTVATDVVKALGDVPNIPQAIKAFEGQSLKTKVVESLIILDDAGKIVGLFFPPVAVIANDVGIAIEVEQVLEPIVGPVIEKIAAPIVEWAEHVFDPPPAHASGRAAPRRETRPLLILSTKP